MVKTLGSGVIAAVLLLFPIAAAAQSDTAWVRYYNGPGNGSDRTMAMAVDKAGNVYVTGNSSGGASYDFATLKYSDAGKLLWERRYTAPGDFIDSPTSLAVDAAGNVYAAGLSVRTGVSSDYALLKYDSEGTLLWERFYDGPAGSDDWPLALCLAPNGGVCVTGWSFGVATGMDIATLSYNTAGDLLWERRYNGPINQGDVTGSVVADRDGNVFVGGRVAVDSANDGEVMVYLTECIILKYSPTGDLLWQRRVERPDHWTDDVIAMGVDGSGNVIAAASIYGGLASGADIGVLKYDSDGVLLWSKQYDDSLHLYDMPTALALAPDGCIYVTGTSAGRPAVGRDYTTLKYRSNGDLGWERRYNGPGNAYDDPVAIAVDDKEFVCVTGSSPGAGLYRDWATLLYDSSGNLLWQERFDGPAHAEDEPAALAFTGLGDVVLAGYSTGAAGRDFTTIRYNLPCSCDCLHDPLCDGVADLLDVIEIVYVAFSGALSAPDPASRCPIAPTDLDCSHATDVLDVVRAINVIYRHATPEDQYGDPCSM